MAERGEYKLLGDHPTVDEDSLGFARIAGDLSGLILSSHASTPFTLGIEGTWGQGKSSLMRRIEAELAGNSRGGGRVETVQFNAWTAGDGDVLEGLVKAVLDKIDNRILRRAARKDKLTGSLRAIATGGAHYFRLGTLVDRLWEALESDPTARNDMHALMRAAMLDWRKDHQDRLLVVFVDDLDRCSPDNVLQVFEAMKLYLDAPGLVFVVGLDAGIVSHAVLEKKRYSKEMTGDHYLEKVIQIRYRIPPAGDEQGGELLDQYLAESGTAELFDDAARKLVIERNAHNPRRIKRFINSFILEHRTGNELSELDAQTLIRVLILDLYFRDFAQLLRDRDERDPVAEYLGFRAARAYVSNPVEPGDPPPLARQLFESYDLGAIGSDAEHAARGMTDLEARLPEPIVKLANNRNFASLIEDLGTEQDLTDLRARLQRRTSADLESDIRASTQPSIGIEGMEILWIDDNHEQNVFERSLLLDQGAIIRPASDYDSALAYLRIAKIDVIVSDITRYGDEQAGFTDLTRLRKEAQYTGPAIFYAARVSSERRMRAHDLGASITSNSNQLLRLLSKSASRWPTRPELEVEQLE